MPVSITAVGGGACVPTNGVTQDITIKGKELNTAGLKPVILKPANCNECGGTAGTCAQDKRFAFSTDPDPGNITPEVYKTSIYVDNGHPATGSYALGMMQGNTCVACLKDAVSICP